MHTFPLPCLLFPAWPLGATGVTSQSLVYLALTLLPSALPLSHLELALLSANTASLCSASVSSGAGSALRFVEASVSPLGLGCPYLGLLIPTPSASHWALPSPVSWSEAWPSVKRAGAPVSALIRVFLELTSWCPGHSVHDAVVHEFGHFVVISLHK